MRYDDVNFLIVREKSFTGTISTAAATSAYIGCSLKVRDKAVVIGATVRVGSGGSAAATQTLSIARIGTGGTISNIQAYSMTSSAGASAAGDVVDISLTTPFTIHSIGEAAGITGNAASLDKIVVLSDVIWRYRLLPTASAVEGANRG